MKKSERVLVAAMEKVDGWKGGAGRRGSWVGWAGCNDHNSIRAL